MKISSYNTFASDLKSHGMKYALEHSRRLGFDGIELISIKGAMPFDESLDEAKRLIAEYEMPLVCYSVYASLLPPDTEEAERMLIRHAEIAARLGSPYFHHTIAPPLSLTSDSPVYDDLLEPILRSAERVAKHCEELGLVCLYEPQGVYFNGVDGLGRFYEEMKKRCQCVGICGDMGNSLFVDCPPVDIIKRFDTDIKHLHAKDYLISDSPRDGLECHYISSGHWLCDVAIGTGSSDLPACLSQLSGYDSYVSIEKGGTDDEVRSFISYLRSIT